MREMLYARKKEWLRLPIFDRRWYIVLYPAGDKELATANHGCVQMMLDLASLSGSFHQLSMFNNFVVRETNTHFVQFYGSCRRDSESGTLMASTAVDSFLTSKDLLNLPQVTIDAELYWFRPLGAQKQEFYLNYWDLHSETHLIKAIRPNKESMCGKFEWTIANNEFKTFDHFLDAEHGQRVSSPLFEIGHLKWCLMVDPNGEYVDEEGSVKMSLILVGKLPTKVGKLTIATVFYCKELRVFYSTVHEFVHTKFEDEQTFVPRCPNGMFSLQSLKRIQNRSVTLGVDVEILQVLNLTGDFLYGKTFPLSLRTALTFPTDAWGINCIPCPCVGNPFQALKVWENMWGVNCIPSVKNTSRDEEPTCRHALILRAMPYGIASLTADCLFSGFGFRYRSLKVFSFGNGDISRFHWPMGPVDDLPAQVDVQQMFRMVSSGQGGEYWYTVNIVQLVDIRGNVLKPHCKDASAICRFAIYLWKHLRQYVSALYYCFRNRITFSETRLLFGTLILQLCVESIVTHFLCTVRTYASLSVYFSGHK